MQQSKIKSLIEELKKQNETQSVLQKQLQQQFDLNMKEQEPKTSLSPRFLQKDITKNFEIIMQ